MVRFLLLIHLPHIWTAAAVLLAAGTLTAAEPQLRALADASGRPAGVEAVGLSDAVLADLAKLPADDPRWAEVLAVRVAGESEPARLPAVIGRYEVVGNSLRFVPRFAFSPGMKYKAVLTPPLPAGRTAAAPVALDFSVPALPPARPTEVTAIYPSSNVLPENQLRFYIHFSAPMAAGEAYDHVKLLRADGTPVTRAFLEIGEELWDGTGQRLTLLFDPGRVKQGLLPREEFGPVLEAGKSYRLVIDPAWRDANGQPLARGFEKRFSAGPMIETAIDWHKWKVEPPAAAGREPLVVRFDRPLDRALVQRMMVVVDHREQVVEGEVSVADQERRFEFRPAAPWSAGQHVLVVDTALEDSAGNNLARPFEVDVFERVDDRRGPETVRIPFTVQAVGNRPK